MISLTIDRDISVENDGTACCYDFTLLADCECGNKIQVLKHLAAKSVCYTCSECGASFRFDVTASYKPGDTRIRDGQKEVYMKVVKA